MRVCDTTNKHACSQFVVHFHWFCPDFSLSYPLERMALLLSRKTIGCRHTNWPIGNGRVGIGTQRRENSQLLVALSSSLLLWLAGGCVECYIVSCFFPSAQLARARLSIPRLCDLPAERVFRLTLACPSMVLFSLLCGVCVCTLVATTTTINAPTRA